ncbi:pseudouridylate synthase RPUSD2-like [Musca vetustissima]|uniref:pseudouridylate synthase RPUSD2-like n=1 Tax=Musca vetustissima TaxID=27455 RepID=UPI002AB6E88E|nr:pseudouridylate synthase RPUSD2-like [Musca vetustissima]
MQYQGGSWYLPWGIPIQKMIPMAYGGQPGSAPMDPYLAANNNNTHLTCNVLTNPNQGNVNTNTVSPIQVPAPAGTANYHQHATFNPHTVGKLPCTSAVDSLHGNNPASANVQRPGTTLASTILNGHPRAILPNAQLPSTHAPHQNMLMSSTMFAPLTLPQYITSPTAAVAAATALNNSMAGLPSNRQSLPDCTRLISQQQQSTQNATSTSPLACISSSASPNSAVPTSVSLNVDVVAMRHHVNNVNVTNNLPISLTKILSNFEDYNEKKKPQVPEKRKVEDNEQLKDLKKAKLETKALKAKRPGFTDERYHETSYYIENGLRKVYPYYFTFTTFTKGRWVGEKILDVFSREFRAHPAEEYERCIKSGTLTVNYEKVPIDYKLKHNDLLANIVHRHEVPVTSEPITIVHMDDDIVVVNKPASIPVHPCGRYRHNTVVFILAKEYNLKNLRTIHRLDRLTSGLLLFGRSPKKARQLEHQIRNRQVQKEYVCRVEGNFPEGVIECNEPIEVVSYKIGVCKVSPKGKECKTTFQKLSYDGKTSVVLCKPLTGRMHQIRVHLQYLGYPVANDPLYNHEVFGPLKGRGGDIGGKTDEELVRDLINIHNAENWLGIDGDSEMPFFKPHKNDCETDHLPIGGNHPLIEDDNDAVSRETSPVYSNSPTIVDLSPENATIGCNTVDSLSNKLGDTSKTDDTIENEADSSNIHVKVTVATQTDHESPDTSFNPEKMTLDKHCYECKVRYRDPKPKDLIMYLHAWKYKGPGWEYETKLPAWGAPDWKETI